MSGFTTQNNEHLIRSEIWSTQLKEVLEDELIGMKYVDLISDFPDGDTINIPSIGQAEVYDYIEGNGVTYGSLDTGNFQFSITDYKQTGLFITEKMKQDSFYMNRLVSAFVPKMQRAISKAIEVDILEVGPDGQTASNLNTINGGNHRFVGGGTNEVITPQDFQRARFALQKANVPLTNLVAIVDPSVEYQLATTTNLVNISSAFTCFLIQVLFKTIGTDITIQNKYIRVRIHRLDFQSVLYRSCTADPRAVRYEFPS